MSTTMSLADLYASAPQPQYRGVRTTSQYLTMRDGVLIAVDVMLPADCPPDTRLPALMIMARYWRSMELRVPDQPGKAPIGPRELSPDFWVARGFAVVTIDVRGAGTSSGISSHPWSADEIADYGEVATWVAAQPWCSGAIGAYGVSYEGAAALRLASTGIPAVRGVIPQEIEYDVYADIALPGGILNTGFIQAWSESNQRLDSNKTSSLFPWFGRLLIKGVRPVDADRRTRAALTQAVHEHRANTDVYRAIQAIVYRDDPFGDTGATLDDFSVFALSTPIEGSGVPLFNWPAGSMAPPQIVRCVASIPTATRKSP